jgi:hypothetical protein
LARKINNTLCSKNERATDYMQVKMVVAETVIRQLVKLGQVRIQTRRCGEYGKGGRRGL